MVTTQRDRQAKAATEVSAQQAYDLIFMDVQMPQTDDFLAMPFWYPAVGLGAAL